MLDLLERATQFASIAHDKTYRKMNVKLPYIAHPMMVAMYLMKLDLDEEIIAAAILHDTVEDTNVTIDDIQVDFGDKVAEYVAGCTEDKSKSWKERKQHQLDAIKTISHEVLIIKLADKLNNISSSVADMKRSGESFVNFNAGKEQQKWYYQGLVKSFEERYEVNSTEMFRELKEKVKIVFAD